MNKTDLRTLILVPQMAPQKDIGRAYYASVIPLGLAYISSVLKHEGYDITLLNLNILEGFAEDIIKKTLAKEEYGLILTGGLSTQYSAVKRCLDAARQYAPAAKIILGGGLISSQPQLMFKALQPDFIVIGEGELTILELIRCLQNKGNLDEIDGIGYLGPDNQLKLTKPRKYITDIDSIPWPDQEGIGLDTILEHTYPSQLYYFDVVDYPRPYSIIMSRSCPYLCTFCFHPIGNKYRQRSIANIMEELTYAVNRFKINIINIYDELFANDKERVTEFCKQIKMLSKAVSTEIKWNCQMRVDTMNDELVERMKDAGCYVLSLGLESYSPTVLKSMRKKITPQQIDNALRVARRQNMTIQGNFIFGDIAENKETAYETLNYWRKNSDIYGGAISLGFIQVYPGTALYQYSLKKGIIKNEIEFIENELTNPINITDNMSDKDFKQLVTDIDEAYNSYRKYVLPVVLKRDKETCTLRVKCPYCRSISIYKNYIPPSRDTGQVNTICCRHCRMRFHIVSKTFYLNYMINRILGKKTLRLIRPLKEIVKYFIEIYHKYKTA